ncbi:MAG: TerC/Alx family metal homeostasis membrane protein [Acidobacteriota bacterium]
MIPKRDAARVIIYVILALLFAAVVFHFEGTQKGLEFLTGYLIEYSLSVDNLFIFIMIFAYFGVGSRQQHKALNWGIMGAIVFRIIFVIFGVALIYLFHPIIYIFGLLLLWAAYKMAFTKEKEAHPDKIALVRWFRKLFPVTKDYVNCKFFTRSEHGLAATPLFIVVLVLESSDLMFALDSIPAILAITQDPFIVITSNIFAILGLRSLYFVIANIMKLFRFLKFGIALILFFVGLKMLLMDVYKVSTSISLLIVALILITFILLSVIVKEKPDEGKREWKKTRVKVSSDKEDED